MPRAPRLIVRGFALLCALGLSASALPGHAAAVSSQSTVVKATLANGLRVVVVANALAPVVSTDLVYLVGSRDDPPDVPGMAHAQEHMMFRGTANLSTSELGTLATALGGNFNAETSDTLTQFEFTVPSADLDAILRIESDRMRDVLDAQDQWEKERGAIEQEVLRDQTTPGADFFRDARAFAFAGTSYAHDGVGTRPAFERLTGPRLKEFWSRWYAPNNAVLVIAGDVDPTQTIAQVRARFESIPRKAIAKHATADFAPLRRTVLQRPSTLIYPLAVVGYRFPGIGQPDFLASYLLQQALASPRGPLRALVDSGDALDAEWIALPYFEEGQLGFATAALRPGADPLEMTRRLEAILRQYAQNGVPQELFETARRHSIADQELSRNSITALAGDWATTIALDNEPSIEREQELLAGVGLSETNRAAKKYLDPEHAIVGALTPSAGADQAQPPAPPPSGSEKPLEAQQPVTHLPAWARALVDNVTLPAPREMPAVEKLPNGITLVVQPESISDSIFVYGEVRSNRALQEPAGKQGVASVLATMLEYGSAKRDRPAYVRAQDELDSQVAPGQRFALETTPKSFDGALALLGEAELQPRFDAGTFDVARRRVIEELETALSGTGSVIARESAKRLLPAGDPELREPTPDTLGALSLDDVRAYYRSTFRPDLTTLVVVGNVSAAEAKSAVERVFGVWSASGEPPQLTLPPVALNGASDYKLSPPALKQTSVQLEEMLGMRRTDDSYAPLILGNAILGGGSASPEQSRLFRDIRQNAGLAYSIESDVAVDDNRARFSVQYASAPENADRIATLVTQEINRLRTEPAGAFEMALAKASLVRRATLEDAAVESIGDRLLEAQTHGLPLDQDARDARAVAQTDAAAVQKAFSGLVQPERLVRIVVGP